MPKREDKAINKGYIKVEKGSGKKNKIVLRLYVSGMTKRSIKAINNLKKICDELLPGRCVVEVIDICKNPKLAKGDQIIATPTLIKKVPAPIRKLIGDMSDTDKLLIGIDIKPGE